MASYTINIQDAKAYLHTISGITKLTPKESELLGEIVDFMQIKKLKVLDDEVRDHIVRIAGFAGNQSYYNLINSLKKKKLLLNSRNKIELRPILSPGTTLQIVFNKDIVPSLKQFENAEMLQNG